MTHKQSNFSFRLMSLEFKIRDLRSPRAKILAEVGIRPGFSVLDFGCGPGSYILPLVKLVGPAGRVYALDANPLAIHAVEGIIRKKRLTNVTTIHSNAGTSLPDASLDVVLLYDILHDLDKPNAVLSELHRVLKDGGVLSVSDHHLGKNEVTARITGSGLFNLSKKSDTTCSFAKK